MRKSLFLLVALLVALFATPVLAADAAAGGGDSVSLGLGIAAVALGLAAGMAAQGQGNAAASAVEGMARNPAAAGRIQGALLLSLAFMESLVIFTFVIVFQIRGLAG